MITWILPFIGHTGIANSDGVIYDFGGSHYIAVDHFTFGSPTKYLRLDPSLAKGRDWNDAIRVSADRFCERQHNIIMNNCHSHIADTLNEMKYNGRDNYTQLDVFLMMTLKAKHVGLSGFFRQWGVILMGLLLLVFVCIYYMF